MISNDLGIFKLSFFLISHLILLWFESRHFMVSMSVISFKFVKVCFMAYNVFCLGEHSLWCWNKCVFWSLDKVVFRKLSLKIIIINFWWYIVICILCCSCNNGLINWLILIVLHILHVQSSYLKIMTVLFYFLRLQVY